MVDGVIADDVPPADRTSDLGIRAHEVPREEERRRHVLAAQDLEYALRSVRVPAAVERQRDDVLRRLQADELSCDHGRRQREHHRSPGRRMPAACTRNAGTGSDAGRATIRAAP